MKMYALKANLGTLSVIENLSPNRTWFADFLKAYHQNLNNGEGTYVYMKLRQTANGERLFFYVMTEKKFHETFAFTGEEALRTMSPITVK